MMHVLVRFTHIRIEMKSNLCYKSWFVAFKLMKFRFFFSNWCILIKIVLPYKVQSLFSHSEISRRNKMKRTHYANTTKMTAEAASVRVVSDYILPNCSRNVYSIQFYQLMNIFLDLRTFYQYFPLNRVLLQRLPHNGHVL